MSKTTLRKALEGFNEPELRRLILDLYDKSKDIKEFLDFYAEPDLEKKLDQYAALADKELFRYKHHAYRPKATALNAVVRRFRLFEPDDEYVGRLMVHIAEGYMSIADVDFLPDNVFCNAINWFDETVRFLGEHRMLEEYLPRLRRSVDGMNRRVGRLANPLYEEFGRRMENLEEDIDQ